MKKRLLKTAACIITAGILAVSGSTLAVKAEEGYTYSYDYWGDIQYSPDAYATAGVFTSADLGLELPMKRPEGMFVNGTSIYICDTANNRLLELERTGVDSVSCVRAIDSIKGNVEIKEFSGPTDIAVTDDGYIYVADTNNCRILKLDMDANYIMEFTKPADPTFNQDIDFLPSKIAVDTAGRVYCVAKNVNKGLVKFESDGEFSGFVGATPVTYDWADYIWKRLASKTQRENMEKFTPTEYENLYMDYEGFIYATITQATRDDIDKGTADVVKKLNLMGTDILVRNGEYFVIGDLYWGNGGGYDGPSLFTDVTAMDNDIYFLLDKIRGRVFAYDDQGRMLYGFGGPGNEDGYFRRPVALDHMGHDLLVLDSLDNSITIFTPTEYGQLIFDAIEQFQDGFYDESGASWQEVMKRNNNYDLAYIGIGRSLLRQKKYEEAMDYFELKYDDDNYSKAYKQYRKQWVEEHIVIIFTVVALLLIVPLSIGRIRRIRWEIDKADIFVNQK